MDLCKRLNINAMKYVIFWVISLLSLPSVAGLFDGVKEVLDKIPSPMQSNSSTNATLIKVSASDNSLPAHWQAYYLDEPEFKGKVFLAEAGPKAAPVVILIHGLGQNGLRDWVSVVPALEKNYRVVMLDLPGFANSGQPSAKLDPTRYSNLIHFIKPYFSKGPVAVVGHSMGGAVALRYAASYPADVNHLLLVDAAGILQRTAFVKQNLTDRMAVQELEAINPLLGFAAGLQDVSTFLVEKLLNLSDPSLWLGDSDLTWGTALQSQPNINAALGLMEEDFSRAIYELQQPVSILWGGKDLVAPLRTSQLLVSNLKRVSLTIIAEAAHMPMYSQPEQFNKWLKSALDDDQGYARGIEALALDQFAKPENYSCNNKAGEVITGAFNQITISDCTGVNLQHVNAKNIVIKNSVVQMNDVTVLDPAVSLTISESTLLVTAATFNGSVAVEHSRLDMAGVSFHSEKPFTIGTKSRLILSVSRTQFNGSVRYLHQDVLLEKTQY